MRPLLLVTTISGLLVGSASACAWHYARLKEGGWFAYGTGGPVHVTWQGTGWFPVIVMGPFVGLALGAATGLLLNRLGWRLVRDA